MSYNYDEFVQSIRACRREAFAATSPTVQVDAFTRGVQLLQDLSKHCPMTPLLWMEYAFDTERLMEGLISMEGGSDQHNGVHARKTALESCTGVLELALAEFSGCALLHLFYLESFADYIYQLESLRAQSESIGTVGMEDFDVRAVHAKLTDAFEQAWRCVGRGTHMNEASIVSEIYKLHGCFLLFRLLSATGNELEPVMAQISTLFNRWSDTPMGDDGNGEMMQEIEYIWDSSCALNDAGRGGWQQRKDELWAGIDARRRATSALASMLSSYENDLDVSMSSEGILFPRQALSQNYDESMKECCVNPHLQSLKRNDTKWQRILIADAESETPVSFLNGLGGADSSRSFLRYARMLQRAYQESPKNNARASVPIEHMLSSQGRSIVTSLYERAIAECPTVESLWSSYIAFLREEYSRNRLSEGSDEDVKSCRIAVASTLQNVCHRATRNCPYSASLFETKMNVIGLTSANLEPDDINRVISELTDLGFLTSNREAMLNLRLVAITVVKRHLLSLISLGGTTSDYDETEQIGFAGAAVGGKKMKSGILSYHSLAPVVLEEAADLLEDIHDMYDETDSYLFESFPTWTEGKVVFWKHRALSEAYILTPIRVELGRDEGLGDKETVRCFEKLVKSQKPSHPDSWREYIKYVGTSHFHYLAGGATQPSDGISATVSLARRCRDLYKRALSSVKKAGQTESQATSIHKWLGMGSLYFREYDMALVDLCREYVDFEKAVGSVESISNAISVVRGKLSGLDPSESSTAIVAPIKGDDTGDCKRKLEEDNIDYQEGFGEEDNFDQSRAKRTKVRTDLKQPKRSDGLHKVKVGKMVYPAHPFTVHVSNLNKETHDMDLVNVFKTECGGVVHAKILREKKFGKGGHHYHGESKGCGLVQFEERQTVEKALIKSGMLRVGGVVVSIHRSHMPAIGVVPPGAHRINPKGDGKHSKRNQAKKASKMKVDTNFGVGGDVEMKGPSGRKSRTDESSPSSLTFSALSFKPRAMKQKRPTLQLDKKKT
mmetsp:Transcript_35506/g.81214  ORF Transcript_35506/g.81214 Transcript_35506/m.81214 type:complete len:1011 (+) Transcript_35506:235-3267(+)